jgi:hypothetical protein
MQVKPSASSQDGKSFQLTAETEADQAFIDALHHPGTANIFCSGFSRVRANDGPGYAIVGATLVVDHNSPQSRRVDAGRQALSALGQLVRLGLAEAAQHRHISAAPTDPQAQEQLAASLEKLQVVCESLGGAVHQCELMLKKVQSAHVGPQNETKVTNVAEVAA